MVRIEKETCTGCRQCIEDCPAGVLRLEDGKAGYTGPCILCGHCVAICPTASVSIPEYDMADVEEHDEDCSGLDVEQLLHTIKFRRSTRHFADRPVEREKLEKLVQAGRYTATGVNRQGCRFVVVQEELDKLRRMVWEGIDGALQHPDALPAEALAGLQHLTNLRSQGTEYLFRNAPAVVDIAAESAIDAGLAAQNIELAAIAQGLGVLFNGFLVLATSINKDVCEWTGIGEKPVAACLLVGYPDRKYRRTAPRREADACWR